TRGLPDRRHAEAAVRRSRRREGSAVPTFRLTDVVKATGATPIGAAAELEFTGVCTDTRELRYGDLFVALVGERFDAHDFLANAAKSGASGALVQRPVAPDRAAGLVQLRVADTRRA